MPTSGIWPMNMFLDISDVNTWSNTNNLPIFVTATCEFSRFDADDMSIGEYVLFNPIGGGIGLFSTTRLVYASENFILSTSFYNFVFETDEHGKSDTEWVILCDWQKSIQLTILTKEILVCWLILHFELSYPKHKVVTTSINGHDVENYYRYNKCLTKSRY